MTAKTKSPESQRRWERFVWFEEGDIVIRDEKGNEIDIKELVKREKERLKKQSRK